MGGEELSERSAFLPFPLQKVRTRAEIRSELERPVSRFRDTNPVDRSLMARIIKQLRAVDDTEENEVVFGSGLPLNWERMGRYLYEHHVTATPRIHFNRQAHDRPKLFNVRLDLRQDPAQTDGRLSGDSGFGGSFDAEEAMSKAFGETLERHFLTRYKRSSLKRASYAQMQTARKRMLDIHTLNGFLPWQKAAFPILDTSDASPLYWIEGERLSDGSRTWLPAQLVFWNYLHKDEKMLARVTTSGCAGHFSREEAILSALFELIQRDGFLVYWLNGLAPDRLDPSSSTDPDVRHMLTYLERYRMEPVFLNTTSDIGVPSITSVLIDRHSPDGPVISVGGGTGFDPAKALVQAAIEAILVNSYVTARDRFTLPKEYRPFLDENIARKERLTMWRGDEMLDTLSFFLSGTTVPLSDTFPETDPSDPRDQLQRVTSALTRLDYEIYLYEVKDPVLSTLGFHVVRAIVPQLVPLYLREYAAPLGAPRLRSVPQKLRRAASAEPTPWPHPFP